MTVLQSGHNFVHKALEQHEAMVCQICEHEEVVQCLLKAPRTGNPKLFTYENRSSRRPDYLNLISFQPPYLYSLSIKHPKILHRGQGEANQTWQPTETRLRVALGSIQAMKHHNLLFDRATSTPKLHGTLGFRHMIPKTFPRLQLKTSFIKLAYESSHVLQSLSATRFASSGGPAKQSIFLSALTDEERAPGALFVGDELECHCPPPDWPNVAIWSTVLCNERVSVSHPLRKQAGGKLTQPQEAQAAATISAISLPAETFCPYKRICGSRQRETERTHGLATERCSKYCPADECGIRQKN
ncbi:hypothetical protein Baya_2101 [Bagarius yarrelli]|uniref:Uncharacterized protein n=1 Tax=Bagarius yarrelli TaxID=175774 RepID=A0A556TN02_BAGYA|nr:hypothetical protein Baya_2101 [Bagarius yarrelli]